MQIFETVQEVKLFTGIAMVELVADANGLPVIDIVDRGKFKLLEIKTKVTHENEVHDYTHGIIVSTEYYEPAKWLVGVKRYGLHQMVTASFNGEEYTPSYLNKAEVEKVFEDQASVGQIELCRLLSGMSSQIVHISNKDFIPIVEGNLTDLRSFVKTIMRPFKAMFVLKESANQRRYQNMLVTDNQGYRTLVEGVDGTMIDVVDYVKGQWLPKNLKVLNGPTFTYLTGETMHLLNPVKIEQLTDEEDPFADLPN